jgi:putative spermidine/putrescine transport system substrate-binding protein
MHEHNEMHTRITRRKLLQHAMVGAAGYSAPSFARSSSSKRVVISGWGGATQRAMRHAFFDPFTQATGIEVEEHVYGSHGLARLKAQLRHGTPQIDLLDGPPFWPSIAIQQGLLEKISLPNVDKSDFMAGAVADSSFGYSTVSFGITRMSNRASQPKNWSEFWDVRGHPGRRALFGSAVARHLEYALMAEGAALQEVYPLTDQKIEMAFRNLRQIKPHVTLWYQTPTQCERLLLEQQIDVVEFFSGRAFFLKDRGVPLEFEWNQAILNLSVFVLAKNAPNHENALLFLRFIAEPEPQAHFARLIHYGPTNFKALKLIEDPVTLERLPTYGPNLAKQLVLDSEWWGRHYQALSARWSQFLAS